MKKIDRKYLPSEQFVARIIIIIIILVFAFGIYELASFLKGKIRDKKQPAELRVGDIIEKDSNNNGISDWEEYLWGFDPKRNGESNKEQIMAKKKTLSENESVSVENNVNVGDNEALARQFFALIVSLQQSGQLNDDTMKSISDAMGQTIEPTALKNTYNKEMLNIIQVSPASLDKYHKDLNDLFNKYSDKNIGDELTLLAQGVGSGDPQALILVQSIASSYKSFAKDLIKIPVPSNVSLLVLDLANSYDKTGVSLDGLSSVLNDPILGMKSITNYKKYSDSIVSDLEKLSANLQ